MTKPAIIKNTRGQIIVPLTLTKSAAVVTNTKIEPVVILNISKANTPTYTFRKPTNSKKMMSICKV